MHETSERIQRINYNSKNIKERVEEPMGNTVGKRGEAERKTKYILSIMVGVDRMHQELKDDNESKEVALRQRIRHIDEQATK